MGAIHKVLEVRFNRPGTYRYHGDPPRGAGGTIIVQGTALPGPEFDIREIPSPAASPSAWAAILEHFALVFVQTSASGYTRVPVLAG